MSDDGGDAAQRQVKVSRVSAERSQFQGSAAVRSGPALHLSRVPPSNGWCPQPNCTVKKPELESVNFSYVETERRRVWFGNFLLPKHLALCAAVAHIGVFKDLSAVYKLDLRNPICRFRFAYYI